MKDLYYTAPTNKAFNEVKEKAIEIWKTYDNKFGYVDEKVNRIKDIKNVEDNVMFIIALFDSNNIKLLALSLSKETRKAVSDRMVDGGNPPEYNPFLEGGE